MRCKSSNVTDTGRKEPESRKADASDNLPVLFITCVSAYVASPRFCQAGAITIRLMWTCPVRILTSVTPTMSFCFCQGIKVFVRWHNTKYKNYLSVKDVDNFRKIIFLCIHMCLLLPKL